TVAARARLLQESVRQPFFKAQFRELGRLDDDVTQLAAAQRRHDDLPVPGCLGEKGVLQELPVEVRAQPGQDGYRQPPERGDERLRVLAAVAGTADSTAREEFLELVDDKQRAGVAGER